MAIAALPTPPSRQDPVNFPARGDAFFGALPQFVTEANALQSDVNAKQSAVAQSQIAVAASQAAAAASQSAASVSANLAASSSGAALWVSGTNYAAGIVVYSALTGRSYRRLVAGTGTTDPSVDTANWRPLLLDIDTGYPTILPSLNLDFANSKILDPRITFSRASTATYYDGKTVAKAEENLLRFSQDFDNAAWSADIGPKPTIAPNSVPAPDGTTTADTLVFSAQFQAVAQSVLTAGTQYTISAWLRSDSGTRVISVSGSEGNVYSTFNVTTTWNRFTATFIAVSSSIEFQDRNSSGFVSMYIWGAQLEARSSATAYTQTNAQPITIYAPILKTAFNNTPRFDHNPITGESLGLLIEEQRTNLITYSSDLYNWYLDSAFISNDSAVAPDGTLSADKVSENLSNSYHLASKMVYGLNTSQKFTFSFFAKSGGRNFVYARVSGAFALDYGASFNLSSGIVNNVVGCTASISSIGNGWYRCILFMPTPINTSTSCYIFTAKDGLTGGSSNPVYQGNGFSGIYLWGAQVEIGAFNTSYIPTNSAQATRAADNASMTGVNFTSWYRQDEGTIFADYLLLSAIGSVKRVLDFSNTNKGVYSEIISINGNNSESPIMYSEVWAGGSSQAVISMGDYSSGSWWKSAIALRSNDFVAANNGSISGMIASGNVPYVNKLWIGLHADQNIMNGYIRKISYYPKRLSNSELQALTS